MAGVARQSADRDRQPSGTGGFGGYGVTRVVVVDEDDAQPRGAAAAAGGRDAKKTDRIHRWRAEVDPRDVFCSCSHRLDQGKRSRSGSRSSSSIARSPSSGRCPACGGLADAAAARRNPGDEDDGDGSSRGTSRVRLSIRGLFRRARTPSSAAGASTPTTQMYRREALADDGDDEGSSSDAGRGGDRFSDSDGRGKPRLNLDDTAARLRRAQKLLHAQGKGQSGAGAKPGA
ncbi:hypothetical protein JX265_008916 [Neoarthrinium moseri]|uniref:Uncharacterized protein n=1 Tax=Neoarthrinium moseri TaxID=1658444 RepID=A0A9P9WGY2_9PEZI|nr:hypothetical protein JX266_013154 [Neoarthrinium moseri]KAI1862870.1 hypothetical protein JX265_008916 [Neoarthrinium moseri]